MESSLETNSQSIFETPTSSSLSLSSHEELVSTQAHIKEEVVFLQTHSHGRSRKPKKNLNNDQRQAIVQFLLEKSNNGRVKRDTIAMASQIFSTSMRTVDRIWKRAKESLHLGMPINVSSRIPKRVGRKRFQIDVNRIPEIPLRRRTNIRSMAHALNVSKSTLHRRIKEGMIRPHSNALKPFLTTENKKKRLEFCLEMLEPGIFNNNLMFKDMFDCIHIDEKWFFMTKQTEKYYLLPDELEPLRTCKSKRFITKVMFLAAVARPRFDSFGNEVFSGKIGIFPFTIEESTKRSSKNRIAGTLETKPILSVTKDVVRSCLIEKVLLAIRAKWPSSNTSTIFIQQDNAKPHVDPNDVELLEAASKYGFDIRLMFQPPNSPDMNVLDLGFFRAIQSLQHQEAPNTVDELISAVEKSFNDLSSQSLNSVFLTLQLCMLEVLKVRGGIDYKLPHIGKNRLERTGDLPKQIEVDNDLVLEILEECH